MLFFLILLSASISAFLYLNQMYFFSCAKKLVVGSDRNDCKELMNTSSIAYARLITHFTLLVWLFELMMIYVLTLGGGLNRLATTISNHLFLSETLKLYIYIFILTSIIFWLKSIFLSIKVFFIQKPYMYHPISFYETIKDQVKKYLLVMCLIMLTSSLILFLYHEFAQAWIWIWLIGVTLILYEPLYVLFILPIFYRQQDLPLHYFSQNFVSLLQSKGFSLNQIIVIEHSKKSRHANAQVICVGKFKRIIIFDTLMKALKKEQLEAVIAHEIGHVVYQHQTKSFFITALLSLFGLWCVANILEGSGFYALIHSNKSQDYVALSAIVVLWPLFNYFYLPLRNYLRRRWEYKADEFAALQGYAQLLHETLILLSKQNLNQPIYSLLYSAWHHTHPDLTKRLSSLEKAITVT